MDGAYVAAMNDHLTRVLGVDTGKPYTVFNREALMGWAWVAPPKEGSARWPTYVNVAPVLGKLLRENPSLRVLVANGLFDLATPFHAVETTMVGNGIDSARLTMAYYEAGHMMYLHEPSLSALVADMRGWMRGK